MTGIRWAIRFKVEGHGMAPALESGQVVVADRFGKPVPGRWAVMVPEKGAVRVGFFRSEGGQNTLASFDTTRPPIILSEDALKRVFPVVGTYERGCAPLKYCNFKARTV
jgi:hypothetical protein